MDGLRRRGENFAVAANAIHGWTDGDFLLTGDEPNDIHGVRGA